MKVNLLDEGFVYILKKKRISPKIQRRRFREIKDFGLGRLPTHVRILPTLVYFHPKGLILGKMWWRGLKALFGQFRNYLKPFYGFFVASFVVRIVKCPWNAQSIV